ncbi:MAG: tetratricopeptide repeat protein [Myxococcaceae bacterium]|nr:tetratricopeptide repeat protein [Myxococcaceae bacterium]MCI0672201.1 tetratricopeptide repeat protein [Myxococcaceae bacterium]
MSQPRPARTSHALAARFTGLVLALSACQSRPGTREEVPALDKALYDEGKAAFDARHFAEAQGHFDVLWQRFPDSSRHDDAGYFAGRCRFGQGDFRGALDVFTAMRAAHPDSVYVDQAAYFSGRARFELEDYLGAVQDFRASLQADPDGQHADNALSYLGRALFELKDYPAAIAELTRLEQTYPESTYLDSGRFYLGRCYFAQGEYARALPAFERVFLTKGSDFADDARYWTGRSRYRLQQLEAALADFRDVVATYPDSVYADNALHYQVRIHVDRKDCPAAAQALAELRTRYPQSDELASADATFRSGGCSD